MSYTIPTKCDMCNVMKNTQKVTPKNSCSKKGNRYCSSIRNSSTVFTYAQHVDCREMAGGVSSAIAVDFFHQVFIIVGLAILCVARVYAPQLWFFEKVHFSSA